MPCLAAAVAVPMRKLWPLKGEASIPASVSTSRTRVTSVERDSGEPSKNINSGPGLEPRMARKLIIAVTGQMSESVLPRKIETPLRKGSVLLAFIVTRTTEGLIWESMAISPRLRW